VDEYQVLDDKNTVWVNDKVQCVARFSRRNMEFINNGVTSVAVSKPSTAWIEFKSIVKNTFGVVVDDSHRPSWV